MKVKNSLLLTFAGFIFCLYACKPAGVEPATATIVGKWNILSDSTFVGVGLGNHPVDYVGKNGDYFDFRSNGIIYTKEGSVLDTLTYNLVSNTEIVIQSFGLNTNGVPAISQIKNYTVNSVTIASPIALTPGGQFGRKVILSR